MTFYLIYSGNLYYRHPEHGGPTSDIIYADFFRAVDSHLARGMAYARKHYPSRDWHYGKLRYEIHPIHEKEVEIAAYTDTRARAMAKLTPEEKQALGLPTYEPPP